MPSDDKDMQMASDLKSVDFLFVCFPWVVVAPSVPSALSVHPPARSSCGDLRHSGADPTESSAVTPASDRVFSARLTSLFAPPVVLSLFSLVSDPALTPQRFVFFFHVCVCVCACLHCACPTSGRSAQRGRQPGTELSLPLPSSLPAPRAPVAPEKY